MPLVTARAP